LSEVENDIRYNLLRDKKAEKISAELTDLAGKQKTLDALAGATGSQVQEATQVNLRTFSVTGAGIEPALIASATVAEQGVLAGPVKGNNGIYYLTVNNATSAQAEDLKLVKERLATTFQMRGSYEAYDALRKSANIVDKRYKFY
jgi:peptidyl-prolyl cis-trans isomerase D